MSLQPSASKKPLLFIGIVFCILVAASFFSGQASLPAIKKVNFISDVTKDKSKPLVRKIKRPLVAPVMAKGDSVYPLRDYLSYNGLVSYEPERKFALSKFIKALHDLKKGARKKVRVAYFGDSIIEGDLISEDFRRMLQDSFGGTGVGFVPVTSIVHGFRETVIHGFSTDWEDKSFINTANDKNLFLSGHYFISAGSSTVHYGACGIPHLNHFSKAYLLYGQSSEPLSAKANGKLYNLPAKDICSKSLIAANCNNLQASVTSNTPLYGFSFEDDEGVYVDNYAFRGISGIELEKLSITLLKALQQVHDYDLIIFQYGPNLLFKPALDDFTWYEKPMTAIIEKFKKSFPSASVLLISTGDKAFRYNGQMETAAGVEPLLEAQNNIAIASGANLWNFYHAMGGHNSMIDWVEGDTALARKDYTHFNYKGAQKIAAMLFTTIMKEYDLAK